MKKLLWAKFKESFLTVLPIIVIVLVLALTVAPMPFYSVVLFLLSALMMILGITLFNLGVDVSLMPIGEHIGSGLVKSRNLKLIVALTFVIGTFISIAEPDLHVLARQVSGIPDSVIILAVSAGVGLALVGAFLRILFQVRLSSILAVCYILAFIVSGFTSKNFLSVAWESGAVTTGPIMVPFVMALGLGLASVRGDKTSEEDSFGLVAFCLIGPILTMLLLGLFFEPSGGSVLAIPELLSLGDIFQLFLANFPEFIGQVALALLPILLLFIVFQVVSLRLRKRTLLKILIGTIYTYAGLVLFLTSVNVGFMPAGYQLGGALITNTPPWALILIGLATGYFVVAAEPAVFVLKEQVEDITDGAISGRSMGLGLSIGVAFSVGLAMFRILTETSLLYIVIPGYTMALLLSLIVPPLFTAIAFDSGAVASGPLAATFLLPLAIGACETSGGNIFTDAFGIVALVALTPVLTIQCFGLAYRIKANRAEKQITIPVAEDSIIIYDKEDNFPEQ
ncbi:MAG: DUF1538 domain-containing protein [Firmicutes bacterium]|uniref:DUF1538 domain-containing protein n=1 Tax=Capillibacterium thermochitinicola TaxID=2699427 RepID=A0A8J6HYS1_9FIRM|nr:DUF1538 domain-containing protein [Capillibacterium thermochitinicola]MBA2132345.1 DUF1538 domain-containing protein [Capillibacterium thermochitinicola]NLM37291.1 DUF1538 domain-containing protein [Bacillota bacterium]HHW12594.1 DUF1538 domain-containing protein [Bacillota bacterium]